MAEVAVPVTQEQVHGKEWVRSFLFSVKIDSPLARLHVLTKLFAILILSFVVVRFIKTDDPDPVGTILMILLAFLGLYLSGVLRWVFRSYAIVMFPALFGMAFAWVVFNPSLGGTVVARIPVYAGVISLGISLRLIVFVAFAVAWYVVRKGIFWGIVGGLVVSGLMTYVFGNPSITITEFNFLRPMVITMSSQNLVVAVTKALGYGAMMLVSLMLVMTSRDIEIIGTMRQFRAPYISAFFVSTMLRSLSMALFDYSTIRQAQVARGVSLKKKNLLRIIADLAYIAVPLTATMLRRSSEVGDAALTRGFSMQLRDPTEFHEVRPFTPADWIVIGICALLLVVVVGFGINFTELLGEAL
jgi:energy-coupling factor transporter transmembrane protein EcfT